MPSTTSNSSHLHSALSRIRGWRPLAKVTAVGAAAAVAGGVTLSLLSGGVASAATRPAWFMTAANVQSLSGVDSATAAHFFNTSTAYGPGPAWSRPRCRPGMPPPWC